MLACVGRMTSTPLHQENCRIGRLLRCDVSVTDWVSARCALAPHTNVRLPLVALRLWFRFHARDERCGNSELGRNVVNRAQPRYQGIASCKNLPARGQGFAPS